LGDDLRGLDVHGFAFTVRGRDEAPIGIGIIGSGRLAVMEPRSRASWMDGHPQLANESKGYGHCCQYSCASPGGDASGEHAQAGPCWSTLHVNATPRPRAPASPRSDPFARPAARAGTWPGLAWPGPRARQGAQAPAAPPIARGPVGARAPASIGLVVWWWASS
jgi:hypothetical protein